VGADLAADTRKSLSPRLLHAGWTSFGVLQYRAAPPGIRAATAVFSARKRYPDNGLCLSARIFHVFGTGFAVIALWFVGCTSIRPESRGA
jgi:acyl-CoA synthetase (AMP-forming)/AMP-acid ligase II